MNYDAARLTAWVHSQQLDVPREDAAAQFSLDSGVRSARGGDGTPKALSVSVRVPGLYSLRVSDVSPALVDNEHFEPGQVMLVALSSPVRGEDLNGLVKAWVLPEQKQKSGVQGNGATGSSVASRANATNSANPATDDEDDNDADSRAANRHYDWSTNEVSDAVLQQSQPLALELVPTENDYDAQQSFKYHARPGDRVYVRVESGLRAFGGYKLGQPAVFVFTVPQYPKLLRFMGDGSLLSLDGSKRVSVVSSNLPGMKIEIGRVLPDQLQHLVNLSHGTYSKPKLAYSFKEDYIIDRFVQQRVFPKTEPGKAHYEGIDLGRYLKAGKCGVFLLHLSGYDPKAGIKKHDADDPNATTDDDDGGGDHEATDSDSEGNDSSANPTDTRLIVITDLGMIAKRALDGSVDVFVQSIHTGRPVAGATVSVLAVNGEPLFTQATSADGAVHFPSFKGLERDRKPSLFIVKKGEDLSFLPVAGNDRQLDFSRFDVDGERNATSTGQLSAWLFSDRGLYRPGEQIHVGMVVRAASWARSPAGVPLQVEIVDPRGITVKRQPLSVDASGFTDLQYSTADTALTGTWTINLYVVKNGKVKDGDDPIGSASVMVREFLPDQMKVQARLSDQAPMSGWVKPDGLKGVVDAQNLFGTPAQNRRVAASLTLRPTWPSFANWQGWHFFDAQHAKDTAAQALQDGRTDDHGHVEFDLDLKQYASSTYQLYFLAKAYDAESGRSVAASAQALVSPDDWLVGYRARDDLNYIQRGSPRTVRLVAIDPQTKSIPLSGLHAQLIERRYVSVLTKTDADEWQYVSKLKEVPVGSDKPLAIPAGGLDYTLPTSQPGNYALVIRNANQTEVNRIEYSVVGAANVSRSLDRNAELEVHLGKPDYRPGEQIDIAIRAPYAGNGLITIERDKVYAHAWFHSSTTSSVQHITVPRDFEGNGYINVQYVRDPSSDEIFMSPLSYGVAPFSVNMDARRNALTVDAPALVKPGQTISFKVHSAHPAKVVVFAVDEGILQVAHYKLGDPLKFFFRKRMLEVSTSQILDLILPEFEKLMKAAAAGGDGDNALARQLNPFKRRHDKPVAYWSGIVDVTGERTFSYTVPDSFNGRLRVMAVSASPGQVGAVEGATIVRGDFVLSPNVPTTLAPGDEADVSVGVANNLTDANGKASDQPMPVTVALKTGAQLQVIGAAEQTLNLAPLHEGTVIFHVRATDLPGSGSLNFSARHGDKATQQNVDIAVRPAVAWRTQIDMARVDAGSQSVMTDLRPMYDAWASREARISTVPVVLSTGLASYLANWQHLCSEQLASAAVARLVARSWPAASSGSSAGQAQMPSDLPGLGGFGSTGGFYGDNDGNGAQRVSNDAALAQYLDTLRSRQNAQGGFGVWVATPDADPFISAYVMHVLLDMRERGIVVPQDMIDAGNQYLLQLANNDGLDSLDQVRQRAYAVYLLTRQGNVTTNSLAAVQQRLQQVAPNDWKNDLAAAWLAASYKLLKEDKVAGQLMDGPQHMLERKPLFNANDGDGGGEGYYIDPLVRDASTLYLLARYFPERARQLSPNVMENIVGPLSHDDFDTLSAAMTMLAFDAYAHANATSLDKLSIQEVDGHGSAKDISSIRGNLLRAGSWSSAATQLRFVNGSSLPAWRVMSQSGFDRSVPVQPLHNGLEIVREYTDTNGQPLKKITVGEEIDVHVRVRATGKSGVTNLAIVDLLPGGFEVVPVASVELDANTADTANAQNGDASSRDEGSHADDSGNGSASVPYRSRSGRPGSTWQPDFVDVREDRVVIYGHASTNVQEFVYRIKADNAGHFAVPPAYGESMYDRRVQARSAGGAALTVVSP